MRKRIQTFNYLLCLLLLLVANTLFSQSYSQIDNLVKAYPKSFSSVEQLAERINRDFTTDASKSRAIFTWIALNTKYDLRTANSNAGMIAYSYSSEEEKLRKELKIRRQFANKALRSGKGICQDYSSLFHVLCDLTGIKCIDIAGTSKAHPTQIGQLPESSDHQWNAVKIGNEWKFIDVTWAAGSVSSETGKFIAEFNDAYFFTAPEVFFLNHFPDDKRFLLTDKTAREFAELPLYYGPYIKSTYEIASPEKGIFATAKSAVIPFRIIDFPRSSKISYVFTNEGKIYSPPLRKSGNITAFDIAMNSRSRGFLTVFADNQAIATYRIER